MTLYDALFLYGLALRDAFEERTNYDVHMNGSFIWEKMTNRQFIGNILVVARKNIELEKLIAGATGQVLMNNKAIRVPSYATYHTTNGSLRIVVELEAKLGERSKCKSNSDMCSEHVSIVISKKCFNTSNLGSP